MKILLLAGGDSSEREISLASSRAIYGSLTRQGHEVLAIDPASGQSLIEADGSFSDTDPCPPAVTDTSLDPAIVTRLAGTSEVKDVEVVVIGLHGGSGENGSLQNLLELAGMKYTGSSMTASAIAMNKAVTKRLMASEGIPTPGWALYHAPAGKIDPDSAETVAKKFHFPVIVKPNDGGSTVGLTKVDRKTELDEALQTAAAESPDILIENYISGRELTVAVLDGESLPVVEIIPVNELYDYEAKYTSGKSRYVAPAEIESSLAEALQKDARLLYRAVGASGLVRVDFLVDNRGDHYCLELNTLPGMTDLSLAPMAAACVGIDFDNLVDRVIRSALER